jgi:16S rRNA C1402 N4-methylase RsmH
MGAMTVELVRLLDQAIYSTYCDCLDLGVGGQAQELIRRYQTSSAGEHPTN